MYASSTKGYSSSATQYDTGIVDYVFTDPVGYFANAIQVDLGRVDYLIGQTAYYSDILIEQTSGWSINWELINTQWETIDNNWEL